MAANQTYNAENITVLEGLEAVRKRPGMYIGSVSAKGLNHLIYEMVDNSVDEHLAGFCSEIQVILEKDGSATISDNGRGVPVDMHQKGVSAARLVYTTLHAGGKFDDSAYKTSGGLHGVGSSVVNALSVYMDVKISRDGYIHHDRYERGIPVVELENEAHVVAAVFGELPLLKVADAHAVHEYFARSDAVHAAEHVQNGGLARAGGADYDAEFPLVYGKIDAVCRLYYVVAHVIVLAYVGEADKPLFTLCRARAARYGIILHPYELCISHSCLRYKNVI